MIRIYQIYMHNLSKLIHMKKLPMHNLKIYPPTHQSTEKTSCQNSLSTDKQVESNYSTHTMQLQKFIIAKKLQQTLKQTILYFTKEGSLILNSHNLRVICMQEGLHQLPEHNNKIFLHFRKVEKIEALQPYRNIQSLYLENNIIKKIENLHTLTKLQNLFLHNNMISSMENLSSLSNLKVLNLSSNNIEKIQGISKLKKLQKLSMANNKITNFQSYQHLGLCSAELAAIDLSNNQISADDRLFGLIPQMKYIYLSGNPLTKDIKDYRKTVIAKMKNLLYLDERTISDQERMISEFWFLEGNEGVQKARELVKKKREEIKKQQKKQLMKNINDHRVKKLNLFRNSIRDLTEEIEKLQKERNNPQNINERHQYYDRKISERKEKVQELQNLIENIVRRIEEQQKQKNQEKPESKPMSNKQDLESYENKKRLFEEIAFQLEIDRVRDPIGFDEISFVDSVPYFEEQSECFDGISVLQIEQSVYTYQSSLNLFEGGEIGTEYQQID